MISFHGRTLSRALDATGCRRSAGARREVLEVLERVQAIGLGSLDDAVDGGAGLGSFRGVAEQPILATDGEVADGALTDAVLRTLLS